MLDDMEVHILSRKLITPSANNDHPRKVKISCIDQLAPHAYTDCIFYYAATEIGDKNVQSQRDRLELMEKSLSKILTVFYPLAGRYDAPDLSIDCNDQGVEFLEARVKGRLDQLLMEDNPDPELLCRFVPPSRPHSSSAPLLSIQVNVFECDGFAIGVLMSHIVADMYTFSLFMLEWASSCRSGNTDQIVRPSFNLASIFPPYPGSNPPGRLKLAGRGVKVVTRRFVFNERVISRLRASYGVQQATRVQVVTAVVWRALMRGQPKASSVYHVLNMRGKTRLAVPDHSCGNLTRMVRVSNNGEAKINELKGLVGLVRDVLTAELGKSNIDAGGDIFLLAKNVVAQIIEERVAVDVFVFSSWCRMRLYEVDFGWGKAGWVSIVSNPVERYVIFLDTKDGGGIEAWVSLAEHDMSVFQQDQDIASLVSNHQ